MRSDLIYISFRVGFVLLLTAGFLIFLAYPSVQKYIKGGIMVEVFENKSEISAYMFVFIHLCFVSIVFDALLFVFVFLVFLVFPSVQKYIKGGIMVEVTITQKINNFFLLVY